MFRHGATVSLATLALLAALADAGTSAAAEDRRAYLKLGAGLNFATDAQSENSGAAVSSDLVFERGHAIVAGGGYHVDPNLRLEAEIGYRALDVESVTVSQGIGRVTSSGGLRSWTLMLNALLEKEHRSVVFFGGGGVGVALVQDDDFVAAGITNEFDDTAFAYQFILGVGYAPVPEVVLDLSYTYLAIGDVTVTAQSGGATASTGVDLGANHAIMLGARYRF